MISKWTAHLKTTEEKEKLIKNILGSKRTLERLVAILDELEIELGRAEINPKNYEIPNWEFRQAHNNGYRQCLAHLKKLVDLDGQDTKDK